MNSEFISYEQALALKELGFDGECLGVYDSQTKELFLNDTRELSIKEIPTIFTLAPLYQQAFKFVLGIIENDPKLERKFMDRFFLDFSSDGFQMDDRELSTTYEFDEETLREIINFIILNK